MLITLEQLNKLPRHSYGNNTRKIGDTVTFMRNGFKLTGIIAKINIIAEISYGVAVKLDNVDLYAVVDDVSKFIEYENVVKAALYDATTAYISSIFNNQVDVYRDMTLSDLEIDSLDMVELVINLETKFGIDIDSNLLSVSDTIVDFVDKIYKIYTSAVDV
jgi:acyl carrier protein